MAGTDRQFALTDFSMLERDVAEAQFSHLATLVTAVVLGAFTVFLACVGLFGIMNYSARTRTTQFSIKLAIGAKHSHIVKETLVDNAAVLLAGLGLGSAAIAGLGLYFSEALAPYRSWALLGPYLAAVALIAAVTMGSCVLPLRKLKNTPIIHGLRAVD